MKVSEGAGSEAVAEAPAETAVVQDVEMPQEAADDVAQTEEPAASEDVAEEKSE